MNTRGIQAECESHVIYNSAGRKRNRTYQHHPNCAASQRFDKLYIGGWPRNDISDRVAARRLSMQIIPALIYTNERSSKKFLLLACVCALLCGCVPRKRPSFPVSQLATNHPVAPQPLDVSLADPPDIPFEVALVPRLVFPRG